MIVGTDEVGLKSFLAAFADCNLQYVLLFEGKIGDNNILLLKKKFVQNYKKK